jgi:hypothetical protein
MELIESAYEKTILIPDENVIGNGEGNYILVRSMTSQKVMYKVYGDVALFQVQRREIFVSIK